MATEDKVVELLTSLCEATVPDRLKWENSIRGESVFRLSLGYATVEIEKAYDSSSSYGEIYVFLFADAKGVLLESEVFDDPDDPGFKAAGALYERARKSALRVDELLERMIADVKGRK